MITALAIAAAVATAAAISSGSASAGQSAASPEDPLVPLDEAGPRFVGQKILRSTWLRWSAKGVRGHRLKLELVGGRRMIRESAWREWHAALNGENAAQEKNSGAETK